MLNDFLLFTLGALVLDWIGFSQLRNVVEMFRPLDEDFTYETTAVPRLFGVQIAALLFAYSMHFERWKDAAAILSLAVLLASLMAPWVQLIRERLRKHD